MMTRAQMERETEYRAALAIIVEWRSRNLIDEKEFVRTEQLLAEKLSPVWSRLFRKIA